MALHRLGEERSISMHARIAELLREDSAVLEKARARVVVWAAQGAVPEPYLSGWRSVLAAPPPTAPYLRRAGPRSTRWPPPARPEDLEPHLLL
jgi:hypothetical protein